ncbi:ABC transporter ATP-binding protein [Mycoplasma phocoeninasale]|uniref:ABC transporter ATP-binding protein n=1 Tax=Mycoplasma phocoeninasale TaxID=2726117 RepID=A0A858U223_9MOLU|nr:ABC transporter ATP-binding protein [Mycoplasma phocoeninasale]MBN0970411.1 ABC transporter ATP-binding protein [Mycoplasma phocoeninasale]QJG66462.1 ABC transporter ATP-binding protein [Mycoplasma phocoeninasale]
MRSLDPFKAPKNLSEMSKVEKKTYFKNNRKIKLDSFKRLIKYLNYRRGILFGIIITMLISIICSTLIVFALGYITDNFLTYNFIHNDYNASQFAGAIGVLVVLSILQQVFNYWSNALSVKAGLYTAMIMRNDAYKAIMKMPISFFDEINNGELMSILSNDIENISNGLCANLNAIIKTIFIVISSFVFMLYYSVYLTLIVLILFPVFLFVVFILMKKAVPQYQKTQKRVAELNGFIEENLAAHHLIRSFNQMDKINAEFTKKSKRLFNSSFRANVYSNIAYPYANVVTNLLQLIVVAIGSLFAISGISTGSNSEFGPGAIVSFVLYIRIMSNEIARTFENVASIQMSLVSATRALNLINTKPLVDESRLSSIDFIKGDVEFKNVNFSYDKTSSNLQLKNASFKAKRGEIFAIVGPTGAGKTTIINLLSKFYLPNSGEILIDSFKSTDINEHSWRNQISIVLQDTFLFKNTIMENLRYGNLSATDEQIKEASRISSAADFIEQLELGYDTIVEEGGRNFSQGERQLLAITRAILANKNILILDEATSNVDTRTEKIIQAAMLKLMKGKTSFVIAHRLSTIVNADQILVVNNGEIIERGNHHELLNKHGFYEKLYHSSFSED